MKPSAPLKLYPSAAAFAWGSLVVTENRQGCLRNLVWEYVAKIVEPFPPHLAEMGQRGEEIYQERLNTEQPWPYHRELPFKAEIAGVQVSGRMDFITYHEGYRVIREVKTSQSSRFLYDVIRAGKPKTNHLAQIVMYLIHLGETRAVLVTRYEPKNEMRDFKILVNDEGQILIDGQLYMYTVADQLAHQVLAAETLKSQTIVDRPMGNVPCKFCVYKDRCDQYDEHTGTDEEFIQQLKEGGMSLASRIKVNGNWITVDEVTADNILDAYPASVEAWEVEE